MQECESTKYPRWRFTKCGQVISKKTNKPRVLFTNNSDYLMVTDIDKGKTNNYYVHRIIAEVFIKNIPEGMAVNHIDGDKTNNHVDNLEIVTYSENILHADRLGLRKHAYGERNGMSKLSNEEAKNIIREIIKGETNKSLGIRYGLDPKYVSLIRHKRRRKKMWDEIEGVTTSREA